MYALMGGAALVGAAVAYHFLSKGSEVEDSLDDDLAELGPLELDAYGHIEFKQFLKIFQICSFYGKTQFSDRKRNYIKERREALQNKNDQRYEEIVVQMTQEEEMLVQQKLM